MTQWAWACLLLIGIDRLWAGYQHRQASRVWKGAVVVLLIVLAWLDAKDVIGARHKSHHPNPTGSDATQIWREALSPHDLRDYQALLVLPYYHVGTETAGLLADPRWDVEREVWSLAAATRLPLLNAVTSRTPPHEAAQLFRLVGEGVVGDSLAELLTRQPVLVALHGDAAAAVAAQAADYPLPPEGLARQSVINSLALPQRPGVDSLGSYGGYTFYRYFPKSR